MEKPLESLTSISGQSDEYLLNLFLYKRIWAFIGRSKRNFVQGTLTNIGKVYFRMNKCQCHFGVFDPLKMSLLIDYSYDMETERMLFRNAISLIFEENKITSIKDRKPEGYVSRGTFEQ